jgi:hypothetical protein
MYDGIFVGGHKKKLRLKKLSHNISLTVTEKIQTFCRETPCTHCNHSAKVTHALFTPNFVSISSREIAGDYVEK